MTIKEENELYLEYEEVLEAYGWDYDCLTFCEWLRSRANREQLGCS